MFKSILFLAALIALSVALGAFVLSGRRARCADRADGGPGARAQDPKPAPAPSTEALGKSLRFGRYCGALGVLRRAGRLDEEDGKAALAAHGFEGPGCERIWARLARQVAPAQTPGKAQTRAAG
jgi:hypothetical protein